MIQRSDILSIPYLKKAVFTGSHQGMRYRLEKAEKVDTDAEAGGSGEQEKKTPYLRVVVWEAPYNFEVTGAEKKETEEFCFSEEGILAAVDWLNQKWEREPERWRQAVNNW